MNMEAAVNATNSMLMDQPDPLIVEIEQGLIGLLLLRPMDAYPLASQLRPFQFLVPFHQEIFAELTAAIASGAPLSPVTLKDRYGNRVLADFIRQENRILFPTGHVERIRRAWMMREIYATAHAMQLKAVDVHSDPEQIAVQGMMDLERITGQIEVTAVQSDADLARDILDDMRGDSIPVTTGLLRLDQAMGGGLYPGKAYGFAARKKVGKTILAGTISNNLADAGIKHLFICGEMSPKEIYRRCLARRLNVKPYAFVGDYRKDFQFQARVAEQSILLKRYALYQNAPGLTFEDLRHYLTMAVFKHKVQGFILDYWQLVGGKGKGQSTAEHLDDVAQWIANFCRKQNVWAVVFAQINQEGNTRGGEGIRLAFDQVYQLHREDLNAPSAWLEMMDTRYTPWANIGDAHSAGLLMREQGPYFEEAPQ